MSLPNKAPRCDFAEDSRYATDCGPECPGCKAAGYSTFEGDTLWIFWVQPAQVSIASCGTCHHSMRFDAPGFDDGSYRAWPTIAEVKRSFTATRRSI